MRITCKRGHPWNPNKNGNCPQCNKDMATRFQKQNPERVSRNQRIWGLLNPEKKRALGRKSQHTRRARIRGCEGEYTLDQWTRLLVFFGHRCLCCGYSQDDLALVGRRLTLDHVRPLARSGDNSIENFQPLCCGKSGCNQRKGTRWIDYRAGYVLEIR